MVKNYRDINSDIRVAISLAREKLIVDARDARTARHPAIILGRINGNMESLDRLEKAIKSF